MNNKELFDTYLKGSDVSSEINAPEDTGGPTTEAKSPSGLLIYMFLKDRADVLETLQKYRLRCILHNRRIPNLERNLQAGILGLYSQVRSHIEFEQHLANNPFNRIELLFKYTKNPRAYIRAFELLESWALRKGLTRWDTIQKFNQFSAEARNKNGKS